MLEGDGVATPLKKLFDFARVSLLPGASVTVVLTAAGRCFAVVDHLGRVVLQPRSLRVTMGDTKTPVWVKVEITGNEVVFADPLQTAVV